MIAEILVAGAIGFTIAIWIAVWRVYHPKKGFKKNRK